MPSRARVEVDGVVLDEQVQLLRAGVDPDEVLRQCRWYRLLGQSQQVDIERAGQVLAARLDRQADMLDAEDPEPRRAGHETAASRAGGAAVDDRISR